MAAAGAYDIGTANDANAFGTGVPGEVGYIAAHAALGCAASAASGTGCAGGAIGGAVSAALTPYVASAITGGDPNVTSGQAAAIAAFATFAGGALAGLAGQNVEAGAFAAQNEAINNCLGHPQSCTQLLTNAVSSVGTNIGDWIASPTGLQVMAMLSMNADIGGTAGEEEGLIEGAESAFAAEEAGTLANVAVATNTAATGANVWGLNPIARGVTIESQLAQTEYSAANGWYQVGAENNGYFPLVDFQNGNTLVSLKTVDTTGSTWLPRMEGVIDQLGSSNATVNGSPANMVLDMRVQPGGAAAAQQLISYGAQQGVTVRIMVYP
ncbi:hypothetical protein P3T23_009581 [Paraburkholderia sp. GAS448]